MIKYKRRTCFFRLAFRNSQGSGVHRGGFSKGGFSKGEANVLQLQKGNA